MIPRIISFEGLHRSGKGTQISLLEKHLDNTHIMRGDGSRKGDGKSNDPYSPWWQQRQQLLRDTKDYDSEPWKEANDKLNQEMHKAYTSQEKDYLLLDRSVITKYTLKPEEESLYYMNERGEKTPIIKPDISFILHVPREELLRRNEMAADHPEKYEFRKRNIKKNYEAFEKMTYKLEEITNIIHLNGSNKPEDVFKRVLYECNKYGVI